MKRVLISGGSRGIGRAIVEYFAARGDAVAFIYRSNDEAAMAVSEQTGARAIRAGCRRGCAGGGGGDGGSWRR